MDIKDLNKPQMILLVLLVSFVVSIATGVSVVTLMQPEPTTVTQTINKVIERTIEKVTVKEEGTPTKKEQEKKEELLVSDTKSLVNLYMTPSLFDDIGIDDVEESLKEQRKLVGQAVVISDTGIVIVDEELVLTGTYQVVLGKNYFDLERVQKVGSIYVFQVTAKSDEYIPEEKTEEDTTVDES